MTTATSDSSTVIGARTLRSVDGETRNGQGPERRDVRDLLRRPGEGSAAYCWSGVGRTWASPGSFARPPTRQQVGVLANDEGGGSAGPRGPVFSLRDSGGRSYRSRQDQPVYGIWQFGGDWGQWTTRQ
jgi:hypothetical protein